uniref:Ig-like domain-containing protein n=1 Tax=Salmo trutta TaxID=8032 RepID=A0A674CXR8_SALTR
MISVLILIKSPAQSTFSFSCVLYHIYTTAVLFHHIENNLTPKSNILLLCISGVLCLDFASLLPQNIKALSGSCVAIPCSFTLRSGFESFLTTSCKGIWSKGRTEVHVFDSSLTGTGLNNIQGNLTGNLQQKECTTILNDLSSFNDYFSFRIDCDNALKYSFQEHVTINVKGRVSLEYAINVMEGTSVSLICSAAAPCPSLPPTLTWTPTLSNSVEDLQETPNQVITSLLNFTASHVHHGEKISCTALYKRQAGKSDKSSKTYLTVAVLSPPKNTSVSVLTSGSVVGGSSLTLTCSSNANPPVKNYTWYRVNERKMVPMESRSQFLVLQDISESGLFCCEAQNSYGKDRSNIFVYFPHYPSITTGRPTAVTMKLYFISIIGTYCVTCPHVCQQAVGDTYATLQISNVTSTYEVIQVRALFRLVLVICIPKKIPAVLELLELCIQVTFV